MRLHQLKNIKEGGAALASQGVQRINREDIPATLALISRASGIPQEEMAALGSVGKQATSGDIDLAVDVSKHDAEKVHQRMLTALGGDDYGTYNRGNKIGSYAVPIAGDPNKGLVQVDLMFVANPQWAKFAYHSPGESSKYKGAIRGILLSAVAASLNEPGSAFLYDDNGDLLVRVGHGIEPSIGLKRLFKMRTPKKRGGGFTKTMKSVSPEEIKQHFPDLEFSGDKVVIDDPSEVVQMMFGIGTKPKDVDSAEEIIELIHKNFDAEKADKIFQMAAPRMAPLADKMEIPEEVRKYL